MKKIGGVGCRVEARAGREHDRLDELVGDPARVARGDGGDRIDGDLAHAVENRPDGAIRPLGAVVAVHRVVAADDGGDSRGGKLREIVDGGMRRDVAAVGERVNPRPVGHPVALRQLEQREEVVDVRVDAAPRDEPEQVHVAAARLRPLERPDEGRIDEDRAVADGQVDAHQILEQDAARSRS